MRSIILYAAGVLAFLILTSWGYVGHKLIAEGAEESFSGDLTVFSEWIDEIADHSADADKRKSWDDDEGIKHYIDVDNYPEFVASGKIAHDLDTLTAQHGLSFIERQGTLPWATLASYDSLVACFARAEYEKAVLMAADLSHYVADGHMPMHLTANYNGQNSGNYGIHSRYESAMISRYAHEIDFETQQQEYIENVQDYVFNYVYANYPYVDSILMADDSAKIVNSNLESSAYTEALWNMTGAYTKMLFNKASHAFTNLFYTAWVDAGSPDITKKTLTEQFVNPSLSIGRIQHNRLNSSLKVNLVASQRGNYQFRVFDLNGKAIYNLTEYVDVQRNAVVLSACVLKQGNYLLVVEGHESKICTKFSVH